MAKSIHSIVTEILETTAVSDPREIATMVRAQAAPEVLQAAMDVMLSEYVRRIMTHKRQDTMNGRDHTGGAEPKPGPRPQPQRSWKVQAIRSAWAEHLAGRYFVNDTWKMLADCSHAEVLLLAEARRVEAEKNAAWATRFSTLANLMEGREAATVSDLDDAALGIVFS